MASRGIHNGSHDSGNLALIINEDLVTILPVCLSMTLTLWCTLIYVFDLTSLSKQKLVMIIIFVEFVDQLIDYPINCASLIRQIEKPKQKLIEMIKPTMS